MLYVLTERSTHCWNNIVKKELGLCGDWSPSPDKPPRSYLLSYVSRIGSGVRVSVSFQKNRNMSEGGNVRGESPTLDECTALRPTVTPMWCVLYSRCGTSNQCTSECNTCNRLYRQTSAFRGLTRRARRHSACCNLSVVDIVVPTSTALQ